MSDTQTVEEQEPTSPIMRRILIAFGCLTALLVAAYFVIMRLDYAVLYSDLDLADASMIAAELERQERSYRVGDQGETILVNKRHVDDIRLSLYAADGPGQSLSGFELFNESEMGLTDFAQRIKFQRAIQGELGRTIMMMDGVKKARVHVAIPERSVFRSQNTRPKAAVSIIFKDGIQWSDENIIGVQRLVASSIPGLALHHVTVIDGRGQIISRVSEVLDYEDAFDDGDYANVVNRAQEPMGGVFRIASLSMAETPIAPRKVVSTNPLAAKDIQPDLSTPEVSLTEAAEPNSETLLEAHASLEAEGDDAFVEEGRSTETQFALRVGETSPAVDQGSVQSVSRPNASSGDSVQGASSASVANTTSPLMWWAFGVGLLILLLCGVFWIVRHASRQGGVNDYDAFSLELSRALQSQNKGGEYA